MIAQINFGNDYVTYCTTRKIILNYYCSITKTNHDWWFCTVTWQINKLFDWHDLNSIQALKLLNMHFGGLCFVFGEQIACIHDNNDKIAIYHYGSNYMKYAQTADFIKFIRINCNLYEYMLDCYKNTFVKDE